MFSFIKEKLHKIYAHVAQKLSSFFHAVVVDEALLGELELILLRSDAGVKTTQSFISYIRQKAVKTGADLHQALHDQMMVCLTEVSLKVVNPTILFMVGINGSGKTTCSAKLAHYYKTKGKRVLLVGADTFRAAAVEQLEEWAIKLGVDFFSGKDLHKDPSAVIFAGCKKFAHEGYDLLIIDTAGRLQTKQHLMQEVAKMYRTVLKAAPDNLVQVLLTIDGMLGQNSFDQAKMFHEAVALDGIIITKMDGSAKGGVVFAIVSELKIPILYLSFGESIESLKKFDAEEYVSGLLERV